MSQTNPVHNFHRISLRLILLLSSHLRLGLPSGLLPSDFATKVLYAFLISALRAKCPANLTFLHMIIVIIFSEVCN